MKIKPFIWVQGIVFASGIVLLWKYWAVPLKTKVAGLLALLVFLVLLSTASAFLQPKYNRRKIARLGRREEVPLDDFYARFYAGTGLAKEIVRESLREIESATDIPATLLRPDDRFGVELAPLAGEEFGDGLVELIWNTSRREKESGLRVDLSKITTIDDYIRTAGSLTTRNQ